MIRAEREVIVSAGAYESPKLLMLSGIGPAATLSAFGVDVVSDLPVGEGLQDHYMALLNFRTDVESLMTAATPENAALLANEGRGPLTCNIGEAGGFFRSRDGLDAPDVQFHMAPVLFHQEGLGPATEHGFALGPCVLAPTSRGRVTLGSARPDAAPRIVHNYLMTPEDRYCIVQGVRIALRIAAQDALAGITTGPFDVPDSDSDADLLAFSRRVGQTLYHPTSTCAIGSVVDPELRVFDVAGLRVVDASVFPTVPAREHQRARHHGRGEGRRPHPGIPRGHTLTSPGPRGAANAAPGGLGPRGIVRASRWPSRAGGGQPPGPGERLLGPDGLAVRRCSGCPSARRAGRRGTGRGRPRR